MIVVSDTSPVTNLIQLGQLQLLHQIFGVVILPESVFEELCQVPEQKTILEQQGWIFIQKPSDTAWVEILKLELDRGEAEAIALAVELKAAALIIDERQGRNKAESVGLKIIGLLGILLEAKSKGLILSVRPLIDELVNKIGFRVHPALYQAILSKAGEQ
ncbi:MAG: DUF3368 domain-containing protein [Saprospiraceae bacterium]|nr:DUF3368 domain-containing protein [Saprospiraceae bacterium]